MQHKYKVGDKVVFTNTFGVCWGVVTITELASRTEKPTYFYEPTDTPWFSTQEEHLTLADEEDLIMSRWGFDQAWGYFQAKYGFKPTEWFGCY